LFYDHTSGPPGNVAQMSSCFQVGNGKIHLYTNVGHRLHQKIAVAVADASERAVDVAFVAEMEEVAGLTRSQTDSAGRVRRRRRCPTTSLVQEPPGMKNEEDAGLAHTGPRRNACHRFRPVVASCSADRMFPLVAAG
jgi:hypothetical protein